MRGEGACKLIFCLRRLPAVVVALPASSQCAWYLCRTGGFRGVFFRWVDYKCVCVCDVAFFDGEGRRAYADVVVTSAATTSGPTLAKRASTDGAAAADAVRYKRTKYPPAKSPHTPLVPFAVEALGRLSQEAQGLLNGVAPADPKVRSQVLRTAKQTLSVLVQKRMAELLLSAEPGRGLSAPAPPAA